MVNRPYPVIDLFAGPGGLGEGFTSLIHHKKYFFETMVSIERDAFAHRTLLLRHFFRNFDPHKPPKEYYEYLAGNRPFDDFKKIYPEQWTEACNSALKISLGEESREEVKKIISRKLGEHKKWVLVGGPPCQAYSLVGRSRRAKDPDFEHDEKHFLYKEYLKIITDHTPPVFVMENVKGLLSATVNNEPVIQKIIHDLSQPKKAVGRSDNGLSYKLYSLCEHVEFKEEVDPTSFVVKAESYGVPQARHRMFILGIRSDLNVVPEILHKRSAPSVDRVIGTMPKIRSGISKGTDNPERWQNLLFEAPKNRWFKTISVTNDNYSKILDEYFVAGFPSEKFSNRYTEPEVMQDWYCDDNLNILTLHESRSHMESDLYRYLFASSYSKIFKTSPKLSDFPDELLPQHKNVEAGRKGKMFADRFRVQLPDRVSTTITSHISKDGHYYIHYDPSQCRSLTVREAARLQTFPDNYHFEGPRTSQYHQVGNAVPPYLARQIAEIIKDVLDRMLED
ncbi:DNA (cytosine-5)-methyltransferase 1 [Nitrosomonas aestuarii]|uniref:DNA (cytosine-5-)-methyltransferase n=2 Tax=Nitrosomonas aestuarii TaxID=52441 RepID=A0A1I4BAA3_9PROT|nr:DNA (cytosine-5)-methyltransferase 1 [Nitrosomonas aestuarii]